MATASKPSATASKRNATAPKPDATASKPSATASKRNGASEDVGLPRKPRQQRSRVRFTKLLNATDKLLETGDINYIGLYDIAKQAHVPPASVYHFLPTKEAALVALACRYLEELNEGTARQSISPESIYQWPDLFTKAVRRTAEFYNKRPVMMKLLLSGAVTSEIRSRDIEYTRGVSERGYDWMNAYFCMPYLPDPERKFATIWSIFDGVCMMSYGRHGCITENYIREAETAIIAYCKTFLPEVIPLRAPEEKPKASHESAGHESAGHESAG